MFKLEPMEPFSKEEMEIAGLKQNSTFNPFLIDMYNMGRPFAKNIIFMCDFHDDSDCGSGYFVNTKTGERQRLVLSKPTSEQGEV